MTYSPFRRNLSRHQSSGQNERQPGSVQINLTMENIAIDTTNSPFFEYVRRIAALLSANNAENRLKMRRLMALFAAYFAENE